ncbi:cellulase-like family protein [Duganella callida]|uniref:Cellulase n=1 Tax=Duganella callida TaxID=2561932 RepID=A0A4Y9SIP6_9BURK|nr:cellulase-like family protein [Duganella callida]TFW21776.1 cellulase [Duganella callida]
MNRKEFLTGLSALAGLAVTTPLAAQAEDRSAPRHTRAITMWDFSWLERRWDGAGYEDWDVALDELAERGYDAVRIDAYPHLVAHGPERVWTLLPQWNTQDWGSPSINRVQVMPALLDFMRACARRGIKVGLSTWYREDQDRTRMKITGPQVMGDYWIRTLERIEAAGLLEQVLYVDLCNEWPLDVWAPFYRGNGTGAWTEPRSLAYMQAALSRVRARYPALPLLFSFTNERVEDYLEHDVGEFDLLEHHLWMSQAKGDAFYKAVGYHYERFDDRGYRNVALNAERVYRARPAYWNGLLTERIDRLAAVSAKLGKPLATTECWALVDYKDGPLLKWDWIKDLCAQGARHAAGTGRWVAIATSNFCGPQFRGMWRDVDYHRELTRMIKAAPIAADLRRGRLWERL